MTAKLPLLLLLLICLNGCANQSQSTSSTPQPSVEVLALYEHGIPGAIPTENLEHIRDVNHPDTFIMDITHPTITAYLADPKIANGTAVIILPGGGYAGVSIVKEGYQIAERFNSLGVTAFVLKYRMPLNQSMQDKSIGPLQDAQQAISLVRENSQKWRLDPNKIGIMGFSAGGHLAASAAVHFNDPATAELAEKNLRPDFQILVYPVISFADGITHEGSRNNLIGPLLTASRIDYFSNEVQITKNTPPAFLIHAGDDKAVPVENSLVYYQALHQNGVASQLLIVPSGGHGFGMRNPTDWFVSLSEWMNNQGLMGNNK
ncbi:alpha/beta hydrolase [Alteromonadaceae bacterium BrNp21-10]|nr:alpha/beta hydrolase [Alteromonadaceae bacterium BrNp21-10]